MSYIDDIQKAINYIEENLEEKINFESIAKKIGMSSYYFHRMFSAIIGVSPAEYIRNRRLTCAAEELIQENCNILDVALKYGFESNESFTRAFTKFHGISPKFAKQSGKELKSFSKINIDIKIDGGKILNYRIEEKPEFKISAIVRKFRMETKREIAKFWTEVKENGTLKNLSKDFTRCTFGVCIGENNAEYYKYGIGFEVLEKEEQLDGTEIINIPKGKWIVFKCQGQNVENINELWSRIYKEYFVNSEYKPSMDIDFELYDDKDTEIWIPISK